MDLNDFDLPFATDNAIELPGGSRSKGYRVGDYIVRIPMAHGVDSLNVAAASAVAFWEVGRESMEANS